MENLKIFDLYFLNIGENKMKKRITFWNCILLDENHFDAKCFLNDIEGGN